MMTTRIRTPPMLPIHMFFSLSLMWMSSDLALGGMFAIRSLVVDLDVGRPAEVRIASRCSSLPQSYLCQSGAEVGVRVSVLILNG